MIQSFDYDLEGVAVDEYLDDEDIGDTEPSTIDYVKWKGIELM